MHKADRTSIVLGCSLGAIHSRREASGVWVVLMAGGLASVG